MSASFLKVRWHHAGVAVCSVDTHLVLSARRLYAGPIERGIAQTNSPDRSRTAFPRAMAGRFVKHLFKGEPGARCHTVATVLPCKAQPRQEFADT